MRRGWGTFEPAGTLPIVPPLEEDELISSWLGRTARFYCMPPGALLAAGTRRRGAVNLAEVDIGTAREPLTRVARQLGMGVDFFAGHTIASSHTGAIGMVARATAPSGSQVPSPLRYAACTHCLEQQRIERGFSWLRREWVLAPRTVCARHGAALLEVDGEVVAHPAWAGHLQRGGAAGGAGRFAASGDLGGSALPHEARMEAILPMVAKLQTAMLSGSAAGRPEGDPGSTGEMVTVLEDVLWAFTRRDAVHGDRLVYEAFASDRIDGAWHVARRRHEGPVDFTRLPLDVRHAMMVTAVVLMGSPELRATFYSASGIGPPDLGLLGKRLGRADQKEFAARRAERGGETPSQTSNEGESTR